MYLCTRLYLHVQPMSIRLTLIVSVLKCTHVLIHDYIYKCTYNYVYNQCYCDSLSLSLSLFLFLSWAFLTKSNATNISTDWNNGIILSALVDKLHPGVIPDHASLDPNNGLENARYAMSIAEKKLDVPQVRGT